MGDRKRMFPKIYTDSGLDRLGIQVALDDLEILLTVEVEPGKPPLQFKLDSQTARNLAARLLQASIASQRDEWARKYR